MNSLINKEKDFKKLKFKNKAIKLIDEKKNLIKKENDLNENKINIHEYELDFCLKYTLEIENEKKLLDFLRIY